MRILQVIGDLGIGGSQTLMLNIYRQIDRTKYQFDFIIDSTKDMFYKEEIESLGGKIFYLPKFNGYNLFKVKNAWHKFFKEHPEYKIMHSHVRSYASIFIPVAKKHGVKTIIHSHSSSSGKNLTAIGKNILQAPIKHQADYFLACSDKAGKWLFGKKVVNGNRYSFIPNGIEFKKYSVPTSVKSKYKKDLGLEGKFVYIHVGRLHESKNHKFLLNVFSEIVKKQKNATLLLIGKGDLEQEIKSQINSLGIEDHVKMLGARTDIAELLNVSDVFLFPSRWEGLPISVVEAQAAGIPCIISDNITHDVDLTDLVKRLSIDNEKNWVELALSGLEKKDVGEQLKKSNFDVANSTDQLIKIYENLISEATISYRKKYILRLDDACERMDVKKWDKIEALCKQYCVKPIVAVIPNCEDKAFENYPVDKSFWGKVKNWIDNGWEIALHGYNHVYSTKCRGINPVNQRSEFAGESLNVQKEKIKKGVQIFNENGITPRVFVAPSHTFDLNTIEALKECSKIRIISDTIASKPYLYKGITFVPQQTGRVRKLPFKMITFCYHPNMMTDTDFKELEEFLSKNSKKFIKFPCVQTERKRNIIEKMIQSLYNIKNRVKKG